MVKETMMTMEREYYRQYAMDYYYEKKDQLISLLGGVCKNCGIDQDLQFDHIDPTTKSFSLSKLLSYSWELVLEEAKKCQLLCRCCHYVKTHENKDGYDKRCRGEQVPSSILTEEKVMKIKYLRQEGKTLNQLMRLFPSIKKNTLNAIISGRSWRHVIVG